MIDRIKPYEIFKTIVESDFILTCHYQFGYWPEIANNLTSAGRDATLDAAQYPFVMVSAGYEEKMNPKNPNVLSECDLDIYIVDRTTKNLSTLEREIQIYDAKLYPIYDELMEHLSYSPYVLGFSDTDRTCKNLYYLRVLNEKKIPISDYYDAIELKIKGFKVNKTYICP